MDPTLASTSTSGPSSSTPSKVSPPPRSSAPTSGTKRRIVASRACDVCKAGKRKCDGVQPCAHCLAGEKTCAYTIVDKRRKRNNDDGKRADSSSTPGAHPSPTVAEDEATLALLAKALVTDDLPPELRGARSLIALQGGGNEQEPKQLSFIEKLHRHLTVAFGLRSFPRGLSVDTELTSEVDFDFASFFLPGREEGAAMLTCYFEHAATSYRFVDRSTVEGFFKKFYDNPASLGKDETVLLLMLLAAGCLWSSSWTGVDPATVTPKAINLYLAAKRRLEKIPLFHPRLITVQTFMAMTQLLLGLSRFQSAWMALGQAARLGQLLGLHRASTDSSVIGTPTDEMRRRVFWFSLMMDRYLSLVLGFPALYDESDVTQTYPTVPDLGDVTDGVAVTNEARLLVGGMAHIKLSRIMGHVFKRLHSPKSVFPSERKIIVTEIEREIQQWRLETPLFFHPESKNLQEHMNPFSKIPVFFLRQQRAVQCAFHFVNLFLYRSYLLDSFLEHLPGTASLPLTDANEIISSEVKACVHAAVGIAEIASAMQNTFTGTYWNSAYFTFAALTVLLVYLMLHPQAPDRIEIEKIIEGAMTGHAKLTGATRLEGQEILQESRRIAEIIRQRSGTLPYENRASTTDTPNNLPYEQTPVSFGNVLDYGPNGTTDWEAMWLDMQALVQVGFDATSVNFGDNGDTF